MNLPFFAAAVKHGVTVGFILPAHLPVQLNTHALAAVCGVKLEKGKKGLFI